MLSIQKIIKICYSKNIYYLEKISFKSETYLDFSEEQHKLLKTIYLQLIDSNNKIIELFNSKLNLWRLDKVIIILKQLKDCYKNMMKIL